MKQGERVKVLGRDDREGGTWYKIAPPAGEFRWIHARDIGLADGGLSMEALAENSDAGPQGAAKRLTENVTLAEYLNGQSNTVQLRPTARQARVDRRCTRQ